MTSLKTLLSYKPDHISLYTLTVEDKTPLAEKIENGMAFDFDEADSQWLLGRNLLEENGFLQYEVSNFCIKGNESLHNQNYWHQGDYAGIGSGATGTLYDFENSKGFRWTNTTDIKKYVDFWTGGDVADEKIPREIELLDLKTLEFEYIMMGLRTAEGLNPDVYRKRFSKLKWKGNLDFRLGKDNGAWKSFADKNFCNIEDYALNENGILFLNALTEKLKKVIIRNL